MNINTPRGFRDVCGLLAQKFQNLNNKTYEIAKKYGCELIMPTIVEKEELFVKNMENSSVVVDKEIFYISNKEDLVLRPEMTASIVRYMTNNQINKGRYYYYGPCFRGERPQEGRFRQFYQIGVEMLNGTNDIYDCVQLLMEYLNLFNFHDITLIINSVGNAETRSKYENELRNYLKKHTLSDISMQRLFENRLLRILDSKEPQDQIIIQNAPKIYDILDLNERTLLNNVCDYLRKNNIQYEIDANLVRGLDYYSGIVFEIIDNKTKLAIGGGGEYNNLLKCNNKYVNCIGFALGVDRCVSLLSNIYEIKILLAGTANKIQEYINIFRSKYNVITYVIDIYTRDYKKLFSICKEYKANNLIILYENDMRINTHNVNYDQINNISKYLISE